MNIIGVKTLFKKELQRFREVWTQTVLAPVVSSVLFMVVFGVAMAGRPSEIEGASFLQILIPGLIAMGIMMNAFQNPMSSLMIGKYTNVITELLMIPMKGFEIALAYIGAGVFRGLVVGGATLLVGLYFTPLPFAHPMIIIVFSVLLGAIFSSVGVIVGIAAADFDKAAVVLNFVLTPLLYLGGVFYSVQSLPAQFAGISRFNPLLYLIDGFRYGFLGTGDAPIALSLGVTLAVFGVTFFVASWMFQSGYRLRT